jgi:predicted phosphoribosyltransferase
VGAAGVWVVSGWGIAK